jgi:hypothetical protein
MVHTALLLPEVVAGILNAGSEETGLLYNCLLVNHLFLEEARRILWSKCDSTSGVHPDIEDLGAMILRDDIGPERAQIYANLIRDTSFHYGNSQSNHSYIDQTSWHTVLCQLKFPQLMSVWFWETDHGVTLNTEDVILHYAQSSLRKLCVDACGPLSDSFFNRMAGLCSRLDYLRLGPSRVTASPAAVVRMLEKMPNIDSLDLERGFENIVSSEMLQVIASYPALNQAVLPYVQDDFLLALQSDPDIYLFPKLRYLYIGATAESLRLYHRVAPSIEALGLTNETLERTNDVLTAASKFRQLTSFTAQLSASSVIRGEELIYLARGCQGLEELKIGIDGWYEIKPSATGVTDELMEKLALCLPNLKILYLLFEPAGQDMPGCIQTVHTFGRHCNRLEEMVFSCRPDWSLIASLPQSQVLPLAAKLEQLQLAVSDHMDMCLTSEEYNKLLEIWRDNAKTWLPQISLMMIRHADEREEAFEEVLVPTEEDKGPDDGGSPIDAVEEGPP